MRLRRWHLWHHQLVWQLVRTAVAVLVTTTVSHESAVARELSKPEAARANRSRPLLAIESESFFMAQNLTGQCRQTRRLERIYATASLAAPRVRDIGAGSRVTLAGSVNQPTFGWIRISRPVNGFIQTAFLTFCDAAPPPPSSPSAACGIAQTELAINTQPSTEAFTIGGLTVGQGFRIIGNAVTQTAPPSQQGRVWVPIERYGTTGWVAETASSGFGRNLRRVSCAAIGL